MATYVSALEDNVRLANKSGLIIMSKCSTTKRLSYVVAKCLFTCQCEKMM